MQLPHTHTGSAAVNFYFRTIRHRQRGDKIPDLLKPTASQRFAAKALSMNERLSAPEKQFP